MIIQLGIIFPCWLYSTISPRY